MGLHLSRTATAEREARDTMMGLGPLTVVLVGIHWDAMNCELARRR